MIRPSSRQSLWGVLVFALVVRLLTLGFYPLTDNTEARYAEIARKMVETGQWLVPQIDYGVPFWGKPPLSFWLTAISYKLLGVSEFAARLPALLLGIGVCMLVYVLAARQRGHDVALRATVVFATTALIVVSAGAVMTDPAMLLGTSLSMVAFWLAYTTRSRGWGYAFFLGLAIGLLAKGPVATVLTVMPIGAWALLTGRWRQLWPVLPWVSGAALTVLLVVPWYWAAEAQSPGFLRYFIVGEHWQRFTVSGWKGDLYGSGHAYPRGTIWVYALLGALPWSPWVLWRLRRRQDRAPFASLQANDGWLIYLLCWLLAPLVFFTMARNILPTYVLTGLLGFAVLTAEVWQARESITPQRKLVWLGLVIPAVFAVAVLLIGPMIGFASQKEIIAAYNQLDSTEKGQPLLYIQQQPASAEFYSRGQAQSLSDIPQLRARLAMPGIQYVVAKPSAVGRLPPEIREQLQPVMTSRTGQYQLLRHVPDK